MKIESRGTHDLVWSVVVAILHSSSCIYFVYSEHFCLFEVKETFRCVIRPKQLRTREVIFEWTAGRRHLLTVPIGCGLCIESAHRRYSLLLWRENIVQNVKRTKMSSKNIWELFSFCELFEWIENADCFGLCQTAQTLFGEHSIGMTMHKQFDWNLC